MEAGGTLQSKSVTCVYCLVELLASGSSHYKSPRGVLLFFCCGFD